MLAVTFPAGFEAERRYVSSVIFGDHLDVSYSVAVRPEQSETVITMPNGSTVRIRDCFFAEVEEGNWIHEHNLPRHAVSIQCDIVNSICPIVLYGTTAVSINDHTPRSIRIHADIWGTIFFMLSRWEELLPCERDEHDRFTASLSTAQKLGFLDRPVVDEWVEFLWQLLVWCGYKGKRRQWPYRVVPTHDVDVLRRYRTFTAPFRAAVREVVRNHDTQEAFTSLSFYGKRLLGKRCDPCDTFSFLMDVSEKAGVTSHFYFMGGGNHPNDFPYPLDNLLKRTVRRIRERGHIIGFHASYETARSFSRFQEEKCALEKAVGLSVNEGRQHFLRFSVPHTWQLWEDAGMATDATAGYADIPGFRCGTCRPFTTFNCQTRKHLHVREMPLIVMDATLVNYQKKSPADALSDILHLQQRVKTVGGLFVILWHNHNLAGRVWEPYRDVYEKIMVGGVD